MKIKLAIVFSALGLYVAARLLGVPAVEAGFGSVFMMLAHLVLRDGN